jgi:transposase-like protein
MSDGRRDSEREREIRAVVERWERSGLTLTRFAEQEGVARKTLSRWRRRLGIGDDRARPGRPPGNRAEKARAGTATLFTEVSPALLTAPAPMFEVVLPAGVTVRVPERFAADALRRLLGVLVEC